MATKLSTADGPELPHPLDYEPLNAARRQLTLWSSILILWYAIGVDTTKLGPLGALTRADLIPYLVGVVVVYQLYRWSLSWTRTTPALRTRWTVRVDALIPLELARLGLALLVLTQSTDSYLARSSTLKDVWTLLVLFFVPSFFGIAIGLWRPFRHDLLPTVCLQLVGLSLIFAFIWFVVDGEPPVFLVVVFGPIGFWPILVRLLGIRSRA